MGFNTDQEEFWAGAFGNDYVARNQGATLLAANLNFFSRALQSAGRIGSCVELGANVGMNLRALQLLYPGIALRGVEINLQAARMLAEYLGPENVYEGSIFDWPGAESAELALVKGVLIHIDPKMLGAAYRKLYEASRRWVLVCEYYNPSPMSIPYRGHSDRLFKRDFAGDMLDTFSDLRLVDYGFVYRRDPAFPLDDVTWFLMEKKG